MRNWIGLHCAPFALAANLIAAQPASAECKINYPRAIGCYFSAEAAADAYLTVKRDPTALDKDYVRARISNADCVSIVLVHTAPRPIQLIRQGRVPYSDGWVEIDHVVVPNAQYGDYNLYIASDWLAGDCDVAPRHN